MSKYIPKPYDSFYRDNNVKVGLSNYATKRDIKNITHIDTSGFALKTNWSSLKTDVDKLDINKLKSLPNNLSNLKTKVDKLDIDKLITVPVDLSKLSNVVKNEVVKKTEYNAKIKSIEDKIPDITNLATKSILNTKINEVKNEIPSISGLAKNSALTAVENKRPNVNNLVKKSDYDTKVNEIEKKITDHTHDKCITTPEFSKLAAENFAARLAQADLVTKTDFDNKLTDLNRKIVSTKTKDLVIENKLKKLKTFDSSYFQGKSHFEEDGTQNWLVFQPMQRYFKLASDNPSIILSRKSKGLSDERIKAPTTSNKILNPLQNYVGTKARVRFTGACLKQEKITFSHGKIVNIYIVYEIEKSVNISSYPTLQNCLFGAVKITSKHVDVDQYKYSENGIGFDKKGSYSIGNKIGRNVIIFGVDMSSSRKNW